MKPLSTKTLRTRVKLAIYLNAGHDRNGNPKRGWLVVDGNGDAIEFIDEGYTGDAELRKKHPGIPRTGRLEVQHSTYATVKRFYEKA